VDLPVVPVGIFLCNYWNFISIKQKKMIFIRSVMQNTGGGTPLDPMNFDAFITQVK
jgi:hypothetical protein